MQLECSWFEWFQKPGELLQAQFIVEGLPDGTEFSRIGRMNGWQIRRPYQGCHDCGHGLCSQIDGGYPQYKRLPALFRGDFRPISLQFVAFNPQQLSFVEWIPSSF